MRDNIACMGVNVGDGWPIHGVENLPWQQQMRGGTREDRMIRSVDASIPPLIADLDYKLSNEEILASEKAMLALANADANALAEGHSEAISRFMIRSESSASSKIERINASAIDYARALGGNKSNSSATSMVSASRALHEMITEVGRSGRFDAEVITSAHRELMADDPHEAAYAGRVRDMQNWIGGSDYSPRDAFYIPPAPERVGVLIEDLIDYLNRDDVPILVQAMISHAQFESIHPFTDGNGRIGRALVSAVLYRRGAVKNVVIPIASGILAKRDNYFAGLDSYRRGNPSPLILLFAQSAQIAARESNVTMTRLKGMPSIWREEIKPRKGSVAELLIGAFTDRPVMSMQEIEAAAAGVATSQIYRVIDQFAQVGLIEEVTNRKKNRVWATSEVMAELDDLERRIGRGMSASRL